MLTERSHDSKNLLFAVICIIDWLFGGYFRYVKMDFPRLRYISAQMLVLSVSKI